MREFQDKRSVNSSSDTLFDKNVALPINTLKPVKEKNFKQEIFSIPQQESMRVYRAGMEIQQIPKELKVKPKIREVIQEDEVSSLDSLPLKARIKVDDVVVVDPTVDLQRDDYMRKTNRILFTNIATLERDAAVKGTDRKVGIVDTKDETVEDLDASAIEMEEIKDSKSIEIPEEIDFVVESCENEDTDLTILETLASKYKRDPYPELVAPINIKKPLVILPAKTKALTAIHLKPVKVYEPNLKPVHTSSNVNEQISKSIQSPKVDTADESIQRILGFLRTVEQDDAESSPGQIKSYSPSPSVQSSTCLDGVKQKIMRQQLEIDEKSRSLELFKNEIRKVKEEIREQAQQLYVLHCF
jgi:hypothetical protein